jgi:hypothetical protein
MIMGVPNLQNGATSRMSPVDADNDLTDLSASGLAHFTVTPAGRLLAVTTRTGGPGVGSTQTVLVDRAMAVKWGRLLVSEAQRMPGSGLVAPERM